MDKAKAKGMNIRVSEPQHGDLQYVFPHPHTSQHISQHMSQQSNIDDGR